MALITPAPGICFNYGNYHGSTLFCRNGSWLINRKITGPFKQSDVFNISSNLLAKSAAAYASLTPEQKLSFLCYNQESTGRVSGINSFNLANINNNLTIGICYFEVDSIPPDTTKPPPPYLFIKEQNWFKHSVLFGFTSGLSWSYKIKFYLKPFTSIYPSGYRTDRSFDYITSLGFTYVGYTAADTLEKLFDYSKYLSYKSISFICCTKDPAGIVGDFGNIRDMIVH